MTAFPPAGALLRPRRCAMTLAVALLTGCANDASVVASAPAEQAGAGGITPIGGAAAAGTAGGSAASAGQASGSGGAPVTSGVAGTSGASALGGASMVEPDPSSSVDPPMGPDLRSKKVLIYGVTSPNAYRHASISTAATAIAQAATAAGLTIEAVGVTDATNIVAPEKFTAASLAQYGAVVLLANDGEPFGYPATAEIQNLVSYVQGGGALVSIECATDCYGGAVSGPMTNHPRSVPYHSLLGATFDGHPGNLAPATCTRAGTHPSVAQLGETFKVTDEIYAYSDLRADNQVVLSCVSSAAPNTVRPIAWVREEGEGRVFNTALGHPNTSWTTAMDPNAPSRLVEDHVLPGLLWAMKR